MLQIPHHDSCVSYMTLTMVHSLGLIFLMTALGSFVSYLRHNTFFSPHSEIEIASSLKHPQRFTATFSLLIVFNQIIQGSKSHETITLKHEA